MDRADLPEGLRDIDAAIRPRPAPPPVHRAGTFRRLAWAVLGLVVVLLAILLATHVRTPEEMGFALIGIPVAAAIGLMVALRRHH